MGKRDKQSSTQHRNICFTYFNFKGPEDLKLLSTFLKTKYIIASEEICPTTGRHHYQGYVEFTHPVTWGKILKLFPQHPSLHVRRGSAAQAAAYCHKPDKPGFVKLIIEEGELSRQGERTELEALQQSCEEGVKDSELYGLHGATMFKFYRHAGNCKQVFSKTRNNKWRKPEVHVIVGDAGQGKTRSVFDKHGYDNVYTLERANGAIWFCGYEEEKVLLIDEFYGTDIPYSTLLRYLDGHPMKLPVKGSFAYKAWDYVYITSNNEPKSWYDQGLTPALKRRITSITRLYDTSTPTSDV